MNDDWGDIGLRITRQDDLERHPVRHATIRQDVAAACARGVDTDEAPGLHLEQETGRARLEERVVRILTMAVRSIALPQIALEASAERIPEVEYVAAQDLTAVSSLLKVQHHLAILRTHYFNEGQISAEMVLHLPAAQKDVVIELMASRRLRNLTHIKFSYSVRGEVMREHEEHAALAVGRKHMARPLSIVHLESVSMPTQKMNGQEIYS